MLQISSELKSRNINHISILQTLQSGYEVCQANDYCKLDYNLTESFTQPRNLFATAMNIGAQKRDRDPDLPATTWSVTKSMTRKWK